MLAVLRALLDLLLPASCVGCGAEDTSWCAGCSTALRAPARRTAPVPCPDGLPPTWAVAAYEGAVREAVVAHKEHGVLALTAPLGDALARAVGASLVATGAGHGPVLIVPAPSRPAAVRDRGRDPTLQLARAAARRLRASDWSPEVVPLLRAGRAVRDQAGLGSAARAANLGGSLRVARGAAARVASRPVVVVDDVVTTGATLTESARVLRAAGATVVACATVAATRRTHSPG